MQWAGDDSCGCRLCGDGGSRNLCRRARLCGDLVVRRAGRAACRRVGSASTGAAESNTANCICTFRRNGAGWSGGVAKSGCGCASPAGLHPPGHHAASRRDRVDRPLPRRCSLRSRSLLGTPHLRPACRVPRTLRRLTGRSKSLRPQPHRRTRRRRKDTQVAASSTRRVAPPKTESSAALPVPDRPQAAPRSLKPPAQQAAKSDIAEPAPAPRPAERPVVAQPSLPPAAASVPPASTSPATTQPPAETASTPVAAPALPRDATPPASLPRTADVTAADSTIEKPQAATAPRTPAAVAPKDTQAAASSTRRVAPPKTESSAALPVPDRPQAAPRSLKPPAQQAAKSDIAEPPPAPRPAERPVVAQPSLPPAAAPPACDEKHGISSRSCSGSEGSHCAAAVALG